MTDKDKGRKTWIDIAKAIGIIIVIINHVELSLGPITFLGGMFFVPVFFMTAGYTYRFHEEGTYGNFVRQKIKRLLIPYFLYNLFYEVLYLVKIFLFSGSMQVYKCSLFGFLYGRYCFYPIDSTSNFYFMTILNSPTWFLTCLFLLYLLYEAIVRITKNNLLKIGIFVTVSFFVSVLLHYFSPVLLPWSVDITLFSMVLFYMGDLMKRKDVLSYLIKKPYYIGAALIIFVWTAYYNGSVNISLSVFGKSVILYLLTAVLGSVLCLLISIGIMRISKPAERVLSYIGRETLTILCMHLFVIALLQVPLSRLEIPAGAAKVLEILVTPFIIIGGKRVINKAMRTLRLLPGNHGKKE